MPIRLPFGWWLCRDTGKPVDYPPRAQRELVKTRLEYDDLIGEAMRHMPLEKSLDFAERHWTTARRGEAT